MPNKFIKIDIISFFIISTIFHLIPSFSLIDSFQLITQLIPLQLSSFPE